MKSEFRNLNSSNIKMGDVVQSFYRATWTGLVINGPDSNSIVLVKVLVDRHLNIVRKPFLKRINTYWLRKINKNT